LGFTGGGLLATHRGTQSIVGPQEELLAGAVGLADDSFAIDVEPTTLSSRISTSSGL